MTRSGIAEQGRSYRRGLVLGFTMAEVAVLVIFCLLLALAALVARKAAEAEALQGQVAALESEVNTLREENALLASRSPRASTIRDITRELVLAREQAKKLERQVAALEEAARGHRATEEALRNAGLLGRSEAELVEVTRQAAAFADLERRTGELRSLAQELESAGILLHDEADARRVAQEAAAGRELTAALAALGRKAADAPEAATLQQAARDAAAALAAMERRGDAENDPAAEIARITKDLNASKREAGRLQGQVAQLQKKLKEGDVGTEHPACWANASTGKVEYIFDIALMRSGIIVRDRKLPHRAEEQADLPIRIDFDRELSAAEFRNQTRPLFDWSVAHDCRFFVRTFDETGPTDKEIYKDRLMTVEGHFYKLEVRSERF